jgi:acetylornithine deacetylase/succinyl-diaminopimelate desuccinylase-like protein
MISFNNESFTIQQILSKYIQIPSESGHEREAGEFLKKLCEENGLYVTQMGDTDGNYNFSASVKPLDDRLPNIVFLNHIDVVPPGDLEEWELPPYSGTITDTEIWGRGAFDNKGTAIMQLFGVLEIAKTKRSAKLNHNVTFLAVSCEETQCDGGIQYVVDNHLEELNPSVVIGEGPPSIDGLISRDPEKALFGISVAHKRALWLKLKLELPTSGHASVTPLAYANKEMVQALNRLVGKKPKIIYNDLNVNILKSLGELEKGPKGFVMKHPRLFKSLIKPQLKKQPELLALFTNTITLTNIDNGLNEVNVIPEKISATLDCRLLPGQETESFLAQVRQTLKNDKINIDIIQEMPMVESTPEESIYYEHLKSAILKNHDNAAVATIFLPNSNDSAYFRAKGVPVFSSVPVKIGREYLELIHNYNERIPKSILDYGKDTYVSFIQDCLSVDDAPVSDGIASME